MKYDIICLVDNEEYVERDNKVDSLEEMGEEEGGSEEFFYVWKERYKEDYRSGGLFEEGIDGLKIGKKSYGINDLKSIDE